MNYDYLIVGAGSAGCVLANRLSENSNNKVAIFEAGVSSDIWKVKMPLALLYTMHDPKYNWKYYSEPEPNLNNRRLFCPRGKMIGGCSAHNGMVFVRGNKNDYERWENFGLKSWSYDQSRRNGYVYNDGILVTAPIEESNDYYLKVDLDSFADDLDVGNYIVSVNQLTEGFTTYLTQSLATTMTDDFGNRYTNAHTFPLTVDGSGLASGSLQGILGPEDTSDEDWFKVRLLKGATYQFQLSGGSEVYDLNDSRITWYKPNGISTINYWSFDQNRRNGYVYNDGIYTTSPIESSDDYYLRVDLDTYADDLDVGQYTISVEQLTPGFSAPTPTPAPRPVPSPTAAPLPTTAPLPTAQTPTPGAQKPTKPGAAAGPTVINNYYTTNNTNTTNTSTNTSNNTNNNTNTTINNTGNGTVQTGNIGTVENTNDIDTNITIETSFELKSVNVNLSLAITGESKKSEKVEGTTGDDLIADGAGKDKLIGNEGADQFYFSGNEPYKKNKADQVVDFNKQKQEIMHYLKLQMNYELKQILRLVIELELFQV